MPNQVNLHENRVRQRRMARRRVRRFEAMLRSDSRRYDNILAHLDNLIGTVSPDGYVLYLNHLAAEYLGGTPASLMGKHLREIIPEPFVTKILDVLRALAELKSAQVFEAQGFGKGQPRWYRVALQPLCDRQQRVRYLVGSATDIHDLKVAQQELLELNENLERRVAERTAEYQDLYDRAPSGYHSLDAEGRVVMVNQTELDWSGYSREELLGQPYTCVLTPRSRDIFVQQFPRFKERGWLKDLDLELRRKDGSSFAVLLSATALYDHNGEFVMSRSTIFDNSQRKQVEHAMLMAHAEMERTLRTRDEFLATMSHELRTPLNAVLALSESLLEGVHGELKPNQYASLQQIELSGRHLLDLINDILDLSKIEAARLDLALEPVLVFDACRASIQFVRQLAHKKRIDLAFHLSDEHVQCYADPRRLKQMLVNLLSNAVKFTPPGGKVVLCVEIWAQRGLINFAVRDTGIGIKAADLPRLFQPFTQLDSSLSRHHEGSGLGLVLVRRLAELHGGSIEVESSPGEGSCFTIRLPYYAADGFGERVMPEQLRQMFAAGQPASAMPTSPEDGELPRASPSRPWRLLIAEDNEVNLEIMRDYLERKDFMVITATNGYEAVARAVESQPDLILMDIQMPEMDGLSAIRKLRAQRCCGQTPIIALTALAMPGDRERCLAAGATAYLTKPIGLKELVGEIQQLLPL